ncbi:MAG: FKBP-type peptidyl-prolyl cis-trans isomerase [Lewinellaceae bacterium]|nr:FKBP-type peptidyl-prolyl cis-trans isomerase [Lewinella sp.]MCB9280713.1 FKBP-type peptidyl-prolyl cis-trans isomerase [Lewinellaceae bacterium]
MNRVLTIALAVIFLTAAGCLKQDQIDYAKQDMELIEQYIADNNLTATRHDSGIYYIIDEPGNSQHPVSSSKVTVRYKGYFINGTVFDQTQGTTTTTFTLSGLIPGWQIAIPLLGKGGKGTFMIPSALAYGSYGSGPIPPNTPLIFDIELVTFE